MQRRALLVGINRYDHVGSLDSCVRDATAMRDILAIHEDGSPNYDCELWADRTPDGRPITRAALREGCRQLFGDFDGEVELFFAGHGAITDHTGYLCTRDAARDDWGVPMHEVLGMVKRSRCCDVIIIVDCCHSGDMGNPPDQADGPSLLSSLRENVTILAASRRTQVSPEGSEHGLFTEAVLDALSGGAADERGRVTAPSIYAQVQARFRAWGRRLVFKSHATRVPVLRRCEPSITRAQLAELVDLFPTQCYKYLLDPEHEPEDEHGNVHEPVNTEKVRVARLFKVYRNAGLLRATVPNEDFILGRAEEPHRRAHAPRTNQLAFDPSGASVTCVSGSRGISGYPT